MRQARTLYAQESGLAGRPQGAHVLRVAHLTRPSETTMRLQDSEDCCSLQPDGSRAGGECVVCLQTGSQHMYHCGTCRACLCEYCLIELWRHQADPLGNRPLSPYLECPTCRNGVRHGGPTVPASVWTLLAALGLASVSEGARGDPLWLPVQGPIPVQGRRGHLPSPYWWRLVDCADDQPDGGKDDPPDGGKDDPPDGAGRKRKRGGGGKPPGKKSNRSLDQRKKTASSILWKTGGKGRRERATQQEYLKSWLANNPFGVRTIRALINAARAVSRRGFSPLRPDRPTKMSQRLGA